MLTPEEKALFQKSFLMALRSLEDVFAKLSKEDIKHIHDTMELIQTLSEEGFANLPLEARERIQRTARFLYCASLLQGVVHRFRQGIFVMIDQDCKLQFLIHGFRKGEELNAASYLFALSQIDLEKILSQEDKDFLENIFEKFPQGE